jgi:hypothetical protein
VHNHDIAHTHAYIYSSVSFMSISFGYDCVLLLCASLLQAALALPIQCEHVHVVDHVQELKTSVHMLNDRQTQQQRHTRSKRDGNTAHASYALSSLLLLYMH